MKPFHLALVVASLLLVSTQSNAAVVTKLIQLSTEGDSKGHYYCTIYVNGVIDRNTPIQVANTLNSLKPRCNQSNATQINIGLNSEGGDVEAAIKLGNYMRENELATFVARNSVCASACTLTYLGGVSRYMYGRFGIHRPYSVRYNDSESAAKNSYEEINTLTENYLKRMNITPRFLEAMNIYLRMK